MKRVDSFPRAVRAIEHLWIPLSDGCRLAARLWLPEDAEAAPVPALVEYIPYGKRDGTRERDEAMHPFFAGHGYAALRVDLRGSGESEGVLLDEYLPQEQDDGLEVLRWAASQPWCTGALGLIGKSWGGFNALQIAARRPPELRAIVTVCSTDDRYADDVHYMGGCLLTENLLWGSVFFTLVAQPPDPALVGERWRAMWLDRLEHARPHVATWLRHPRRDAYWKHGSVCEDYAAIACPVFAVGGWADGYSNAIPRLLAGLRAPRQGLIGPWGHVYPHEAPGGSAIGFLQEALHWFDHWLKGIDRGLAAEPMLRAWMPEAPVPGGGPARGRWVAESAWPSPRIAPRRYGLAPGRLREEREGAAPEPGGAAALLELGSPQSLGAAGGSWVYFGGERDQREDDAGSLCFDSEPQAEPLEILGAPSLSLELSSDRELGCLVARLCDVAPDGRSTRVCYGVLNLAHREGHEPGVRFPLRLRLNDAAHAFAPGHRLRLALSTSYWPVVWPAPAPAVLQIDVAASALELPVRPPRPDDARLRELQGPECAQHAQARVLTPARPERRSERDAASGALVTRVRMGYAADGRLARQRMDATDLEGGDGMTLRLEIEDSEPLSARAEVAHETEYARGDWCARVATRMRLSASKQEFRLESELEAREGERLVFARRWDDRIPRDPG